MDTRLPGPQIKIGAIAFMQPTYLAFWVFERIPEPQEDLSKVGQTISLGDNLGDHISAISGVLFSYH